MEQKITFSEACRLIADRTGLPRRDVDDFLRALFAGIASSLAEGEQVRLKGVGTFKVQRMGERKSVDVNTGRVITLSAHTKLTFVPSKELAAAVNEPFAAFEAVELSDDLTDEMLEADAVVTHAPGVREDNEPEPETTVEEGPGVTDTVVTAPALAPLAPFVKENAGDVGTHHGASAPVDVKENPEHPADDGTYIADVSEPEETSASETECVPEPEPLPEDSIDVGQQVLDQEEGPIEAPIAREIEQEDEQEDEIRLHHRKHARHHRRFGFVIGFLCALLLIGIIAVLLLLLCPNTPRFIARYVQDADTVQMVQKEVLDTPVRTIAPDTAKPASTPDTVGASVPASDQAPTQPSDTKKVYDTVSTTRYLTTIARQHYGNQHFWPYIYEENKAILGHPNRIKPGTRVVVPDLRKYGVDPKNAADIAEAKRREAEIYARYTNSAKHRNR